MISSGPMRDKVELIQSCRKMVEKGLKLFATGGTHDFLKANGIESILLHWPDENVQPNVLDYMQNRQFDLVINIPKNLSSGELANDYTIRRSAVDHNIPLITNSRLASAFIYAFCRFDGNLNARSWGEYR